MTSPSPSHSPSPSPSPSDEESSPRAAIPSAPVREVLLLLSQNPLPLDTSYRDWKFLLGLQLIYQSLFLWTSISPAPAPATISPLDVDDSEFDPFDGHWWDPAGSSQVKDNKRFDYTCSYCSARKTMFIKYHGDHSHEKGEEPVGGDRGCGGKRILK